MLIGAVNRSVIIRDKIVSTDNDNDGIFELPLEITDAVNSWSQSIIKNYLERSIWCLNSNQIPNNQFQGEIHLPLFLKSYFTNRLLGNHIQLHSKMKDNGNNWYIPLIFIKIPLFLIVIFIDSLILVLILLKDIIYCYITGKKNQIFYKKYLYLDYSIETPSIKDEIEELLKQYEDFHMKGSIIQKLRILKTNVLKSDHNKKNNQGNSNIDGNSNSDGPQDPAKPKDSEKFKVIVIPQDSSNSQDNNKNDLKFIDFLIQNSNDPISRRCMKFYYTIILLIPLVLASLTLLI